MNALAWVITLPAVQWFAVYAFQTLNSTPLGLSLEGVFLLCLIMVVWGAMSDWHDLFSKRRHPEDEE